jgi:[NiFe] hydrogenase assembly HybE family chaperone
MREAAPAFAEDPARALEQAFRRIETERMRDVPILNPAVAVRALGFRRSSEGWLGVLLTPWCMNLMLLPAEGTAWRSLPPGEKRSVAFPGGEFEFIAGHEAAIGEFHSCSLFSPVFEFSDQDAACETARAALEALFTAEPAGPSGEERPAEIGGLQPRQAMSKRDFLRGEFLRPRTP